MRTIDPHNYPELHFLCWDRRDTTEMTEEDAFMTYRARWRYVNEKNMPEHERAFLDHLVATIGKGRFDV